MTLSKKFKIVMISVFFMAGTVSAYADEPKTEEKHQAEHQEKHSHEGEHADQGVMGMVLNDGKKWETDKPLRKGMQSIHDAIEKSEKAFASKTLSKKEGEELSTHINKQLMYMVENCELEPKADASLHVIISEMMQGIGELSKAPESKGGFPRIHKALKQYPKFFDHPDFEK